MTQPSEQPRTAAGRALLDDMTGDPDYNRRAPVLDRVLAIEAEAHDQALGLLLMTGSPGEHFPTSVLSFENVKRATEAVEKRIRSQIEAEAAAPDPVASPPGAPPEAVRLLRLLAFDGESCRYDHHGHCQTHGFLDGDYRATGCPMAEARRYLASTEEGTP